MSTFVPRGELIGTLNYGGISSQIYWLRGNNATIEVLRLGNVLLLRGSKQYYITDVSDPESFHSKLQEIGTFSDYLKENVPSFNLSMFYVNRLTPGIVGIDTNSILGRVEELRRTIVHLESEFIAAKNQQAIFGGTGHLTATLEAQLREARESLKSLVDDIQKDEQYRREYISKGHGAAIVIKSVTSFFDCLENQIEGTVKRISEDLRTFDGTIKNRAHHGFHLVIKELPNPSIAYSVESMGLFNPEELESLVKKYPQLMHLKNQIDSLFVHRWAKDAKIGDRDFNKSAGIAQGVATLLKRASGKAELKPQFPNPQWEHLPMISKGKRLGYLGRVFDGNMELTNIPLLFDYDKFGPTHVSCTGISGCGKTVLVRDLVEGAYFNNIPVLIIDPTGQWSGLAGKCEKKDLLDNYREFDMTEPRSFDTRFYTPNSDTGIRLGTNLLVKPVTKSISELHADASNLGLIIKNYCKLSDNENALLVDRIFDAWSNNIDLNFEQLVEMTDNSSTKSKLHQLQNISFLFEGDGIKNIEQFWNPDIISVVALHEIQDDDISAFIAYYLVREVLAYFDNRPDSEDKLQLMIVVEEAHRFRQSNVHEILERAVKTMRKKGVCMVFISQYLIDLERIRGNISTKIYMKTAYEPEKERIKEAVGTDFGDMVGNLERGVGIVQYPELHTPIVAKFRPPFHKTTTFTEKIGEIMTIWKKHDVSSLLKPQIEKGEMSNEDKFLNEIIAFKNHTGQDPKYTDIVQRLNWRSDKIANKVKKTLIEAGKLEEVQDEHDKRVKRLIAKSN